MNNDDDKTGKDNESNGSGDSMGNGFLVFGAIVLACAFPPLLLVPVVIAMVGESSNSSGESSDSDNSGEGGYPW